MWGWEKLKDALLVLPSLVSWSGVLHWRGWLTLCELERKERKIIKFLNTGKYAQTHVQSCTHILAQQFVSTPQVFMHAYMYTHIPTDVHINRQTYTFGWVDRW